MSFRTILSILLLTALLGPLAGQDVAPVRADNSSPFPSLEVILLIDESGSMATTDPNDFRITAVEHLVNTLGVDLSVADFRVALVAFSSEAQVIGSGFVSLKEPGAREKLLKDFSDAHKRMGNSGWTDVLKALQTARELLKDHKSGYKPVVVVLSDGQPETKEATLSQYGSPGADQRWPAYLDSLDSYASSNFSDIGYDGNLCSNTQTGTPIYTVAIRSPKTASFYKEEDRALWQKLAHLAGGSYEEILPKDQTEFQEKLQTVFTGFLRDWLCVQVQPSSFQPLPVEQKFEVNNAHSQIIFTIAKTDPKTVVEIRDAADQVIQENQGNVKHIPSIYNDTWSISRPDGRKGWSGTWKVRLTGLGQVQFTPIYVSDIVHLDINSPAVGVLPVGPDLVISFQVFDQSGQPVKPADLNEVKVVVTGPDGQEVANKDLAAGADLTVVIPAPTRHGRYQIHITATIRSGSDQVPVEQIKNVDLAVLPWLDITSPKAGQSYTPGQLANLVAILKLESKEYDGVINHNRVTAVLSQLVNGKAQPLNQINLDLKPNLGGPGHYAGTLPGSLPAGQYQVDFQLISHSTTGRDYGPPPVSVPFTVAAAANPTATTAPVVLAPTTQPSPTPTVTRPAPVAAPTRPLSIPPALLICGGLGFLLLVLALVVGGLFRTQPNLVGVTLTDPTQRDADGVIFRSTDWHSYLGRTVTVHNSQGEPLAELRFRPQRGGPVVQVRHLAEGVEVRNAGALCPDGETFEPIDGKEIQVQRRGDPPVRLRFEKPETGDERLDDTSREREDATPTEALPAARRPALPANRGPASPTRSDSATPSRPPAGGRRPPPYNPAAPVNTRPDAPANDPEPMPPRRSIGPESGPVQDRG